ncbi:MAG: PAS domain S-box protein [Beijerinckiaceae bacterium]|nr:PAS domain S-box protein [Beijerinckiaceae bacterium]
MSESSQSVAGPIPGLLQSLSEALYATDPEGTVTFFNPAAREMWGVGPRLGKNHIGEIWKLFRPDGRPLAAHEAPLALALKNGRPVRGLQLIGERSDGRRIPFLAFSAPLLDRDGAITGVVHLMVDLAHHVTAEDALQRLAAIVESSDDAIIGKDIHGVITDWNGGAQRLFGYTPSEVIGRPVAILIPEDRHNEEPDILGRLRRGDRIAHYETVRRHKNGRLIDISLSVSPIKDRDGNVIGASKIARDITMRRRAEEQQFLLLREMNHRIKNLFTLASSIVSLSARSAVTPSQLVLAVSERLGALATAQALTIPQITDTGTRIEQRTGLFALIEAIVAPYKNACDQQANIEITCCDASVEAEVATSLAMLINEFATNAAKYGALSTPDGRVEIHCGQKGDRYLVHWTERGGPPVSFPVGADGFGTRLVKVTVESRLGGEIAREWRPEGLAIKVTIPADRIHAADVKSV